MQTFLPFPDFKLSAAVLDDKRLGKQILEARTIIAVNHKFLSCWSNHPAVRMWRHHTGCLGLYYNACIDEWTSRGFYTTVSRAVVVPASVNHGPVNVAWFHGRLCSICEPVHFMLGELTPPWWMGLEEFHASHRSNLMRKKPEHYAKYGFEEPSNLPYYWPAERRESEGRHHSDVAK